MNKDWITEKDWLVGGASKVTSGDQVIAYVPCERGDNGFDISGTDEVNARLIAAAPKLLEAAVKVVAFLGDEGSGKQMLFTHYDPEICDLRAAIKKATQ